MQYKLLEYISLVVVQNQVEHLKVHKSYQKPEAGTHYGRKLSKTVYGLEKINKNGIY